MTAPTGLHYFPDALTEKEHNSLVKWLERQELTPITASENSRRVAQFGSRYDYSSKGTVGDAEPIPTELELLLDRLNDFLEFKRRKNCDVAPWFDQCLVNRYLPGQGISAHIDSPKSFKSVVCCFTLGSGATMKFTHPTKGDYSLYTEPRSLYVMTKESRYEWKHQMTARKSDPGHGERGVRWSVTFRATK